LPLLLVFHTSDCQSKDWEYSAKELESTVELILVNVEVAAQNRKKCSSLYPESEKAIAETYDVWARRNKEIISVAQELFGKNLDKKAVSRIL